MDDFLDDEQAALLASMHALLLRRGTDAGELKLLTSLRQSTNLTLEVAPVIERYHLDLSETQRFL